MCSATGIASPVHGVRCGFLSVQVVESQVTCGGSWEIQSAESPTGELQCIAHGRGQPLVTSPHIMGHHSSPYAELPVGQPLENNVGPGYTATQVKTVVGSVGEGVVPKTPTNTTLEPLYYTVVQQCTM